MVAGGEVARVAPPGGRFRNMIGLTAKGAARYFPGQQVPVVRSLADECDAIAEALAEGRSLTAAARALGISYSTAQQRWRAICAGLGWQAS